MLFTAVVLLTATVVGIAYRSPASVISSGDELTAVSWVMAGELGPGSWELYPMVFHITMEEGYTISVIEKCISTTPPGLRLPADIPMPTEYVPSGDTVSIKFSEVP